MQKRSAKITIFLIIILLMVAGIGGGVIYWLESNKKTISCSFVSTIKEVNSGKYPEDFPKGLLYPNSKTKETRDQRKDLGEFSATLITKDDIKKVYNYYIDFFKKNNLGTSINSKFMLPLTTIFVEGDKFSLIITLTKNDFEKNTGIGIVLKNK